LSFELGKKIERRRIADAAEMRPMPSGARLTLFASAETGDLPCCNPTEITTAAGRGCRERVAV
jgi:hypothetical protein